jgi:hypothetical protein
MLPWGVFAAVLVATAGYWSWPAGLSPERKAPPTAAERAAADGASHTSLIVDFKDDISPQALAAEPYVEIPISDYSRTDRVYRIDFGNEADAAAAAARLARDPEVESIDYDAVATIPPGEATSAAGSSMEAECQASGAKPSDFPNDPCFHYQWHLRQIGMPQAWKLGQGKGVVVAVIDTGVSKVGDLAETPFVPGYNFIANNDNASDDNGHGTHVAGTIAQSTNNKMGVAGVAYGVSIMPIKVLSARGSGSMAGIAQGIRWAADHGAQVINMSLGGPMPVGTIGSAIKYAREKGGDRHRRGRQRRPRARQLPGALRGRHRRRRDAVRRDDDLLFELGPADRHRRAGRQHARRPERRRQTGRRPPAHRRAEQHQPDRLPVVHGDVDGDAARRGRGGADRRRRREEPGRGREDPARDGAQAQGDGRRRRAHR